MRKTLFAASLMLTALAFAEQAPVTPGARTIVLAHNAYPDHGKYADRLERALAAGQPFVVEEDLSWVDGQSLLIHGAKNAAAGDPTLETYFFPKVRPLLEKALHEGNRGNWPLITLYLDIKDDPLDHLAAISRLLSRYDGWLTTAAKTDDILKMSALDIKPMMVLVEDKQNDLNKQQIFYDQVPLGGKIRVFGSVPKLDPNPGHKLAKQAATDLQFAATPEDLIQGRADNYHRWIGLDWAYIEKGGEPKAGEWTKEAEKRLKDFVAYGHKLGYLVGVYCLDGFTEAENQGWDKDYNFGSREAAMTRWNAAARAKVDFISTDHYEQLAQTLAELRKQSLHKETTGAAREPLSPAVSGQ